MTQSEFNYIKDAFSQIIDDIAGNPDWYEAARAVASDLGTLERKLEEKISPPPSNLDEAAEEYANDEMMSGLAERAFKAGAEWMGEQGITLVGLIDYKSGALVGIDSVPTQETLKDYCNKIGASRVIVQIRKA